MADITMCYGYSSEYGLVCPKATSCYRHKAEPNPYRQAYFVEIPLHKNRECEMYVETEKTNTEQQ